MTGIAQGGRCAAADRDGDGAALHQLEAVEQDQQAQEEDNRHEGDERRHGPDSVQQRDGRHEGVASLVALLEDRGRTERDRHVHRRKHGQAQVELRADARRRVPGVG